MSAPCERPECGGEVHTDGWGNPIQCPRKAAEPLRLTVDELVPVLTALEKRRRDQQAGRRFLIHPLPTCPSCGAPPEEMTTATSPDFLTDTVDILFERCGHSFTADGNVIHEAAAQARRLVDEAEQRPVDEQAPPTPLEEAQATAEDLRYRIRRAREALADDEPDRPDLKAAIERVRQLHRPVEYRSWGTICAECSGYDGSTCDNSPVGYEHCRTLKAIDGQEAP